MQNDNKIKQVVETVLENINKSIDVKTIIGEKIEIDGDIIIPIINVSVFTLLGGGEYGKKNLFNQKDFPFSVANGSMINIKPCAFLIKNKGCDFKLISIGTSSYEKILQEVMNLCKESISNEKI